MFNKTITQKSIAAIIGLSMFLWGMSLLPSVAQANIGLGLGLDLQSNTQATVANPASTNINTSLNANANTKTDKGNGGAGVSLKANENAMFGSDVKAAQKTLKEAVKDAKTTFKDAKKTAHIEFKTAVTTATDQQGRITALKAYFADVLAALKTKSAAIEAAFQAFINTQFNKVPVANGQSITVSKNTSANITLTGSDPENSPLTYAIVTGAMHGTLSGTAPTLTYTPNANFTGSDSFTFRVNDGVNTSANATVSITVNP